MAVLVALCKDCFPISVRWGAGGRLARLWWEQAIASRHARAAVVEANEGCVAGATVLVVDEAGWLDERPARRGSLLTAGSAIARHPALAARQLLRRRQLARAMRAARRSGTRAALDAAPRTWVEVTAVARDSRRVGVGALLNAWCEEQSARLGRRRVERHVEPDNEANIKRCEGLGYICTGHTRTGLLYSKLLDET